MVGLRGRDDLELECIFVIDGQDAMATRYPELAAQHTLALPCVFVPEGSEERPGYLWVEMGRMVLDEQPREADAPSAGENPNLPR